MTTEEKIRQLLRLLGHTGGFRSKSEGLSLLKQILSAVLGGRANLPRTAAELVNVVRRLAGRSAGRPAASIPIGWPDDPRMGRPGEPPQRPPGPSAGEDRSYPSDRQPTYQPQGYPHEQPLFSDEFLAPTSSNVWSFQYFRRPHDKSGILYITYKASRLNKNALYHGAARRRGGRRQLHGQLGATVLAGKENAPGPTYAYFGVSPAVFNRMKLAHSKGKFVWDELRIRGTVYGHRYRYQLVVGQLVTGFPGAVVQQYIPRKATRRGFVTRAVADVGTGRRSFTSSTLPPAGHGGGFTTRRRSGF